MDPYHLLFRGGQFYLIGYSHERKDVRVFRVSRIRGKVGYSSKAEHDFSAPEDFDPRAYATRTDWQLGDPAGRARIWLSDRIDWLALRHFGHAGEVTEAAGGVVFETDYADSQRQIVSWVLGLGEQARRSSARRAGRRGARAPELVIERHGEPLEPASAPASAAPRAPSEDDDDGRRVADPPRALRAPGHARRHPDRRRSRGPQARASPSCARASSSPTPSCARTSTCSTS